MYELVWGEPGTFVKKRRVRRKPPLSDMALASPLTAEPVEEKLTYPGPPGGQMARFLRTFVGEGRLRFKLYFSFSKICGQSFDEQPEACHPKQRSSMYLFENVFPSSAPSSTNVFCPSCLAASS
eukprot:scaffold61996_cov64-Phaeocystis_antarctica.AAC.1